MMSMEIKREDILHLAELSKLAVSEEEVEKLASDMSNTMKYVLQLDGLDTEGVEPTYQVFEMENVWRDDEVLPQDATPDELLALAKETKDNQVLVPKVL